MMCEFGFPQRWALSQALQDKSFIWEMLLGNTLGKQGHEVRQVPRSRAGERMWIYELYWGRG